VPERIAAKGYTRVVLVLNMKRFIRDEGERKRFEALRGTDVISHSLRASWPEMVRRELRFFPVSVDGMTAEDIGFATGVFRSLMLERLTAPAYLLDKSQIRFPRDLEDNFQFKALFKRAWNRWEIWLSEVFCG
jgi:hypothetical protein